MPSAVERRGEPQRENLVGEPDADDAPADREDVRVVVRARQAGGVEIVAQRGARARHFVGGHLLTLAAPADDDAAVGEALRDLLGDLGADRRIVDRGVAVRAAIVHLVAEPAQRPDHVLFQREPRMVGADRNTHRMRLYSGVESTPDPARLRRRP